jgi:hypothetical protein
VSLDLSAAFDAIDQSISFNRLRHSFGRSGIVYQWLHFYLTGRIQVVCLGSHISSPLSFVCGEPRSGLGIIRPPSFRHSYISKSSLN